MGDQCYFISDLHLGSATEPNAFLHQKFLQQFKSREQISHLFLLGDIFDLWVSSQGYYIEKFKPIVDEWIRLRDMGVEIHYFEGNHDLYLQHYFGDVLKLHIHPGPAYFDLAGRRVRVEHGDQMDLTDWKYLTLRAFWRTKTMNFLAPRVPARLIRAVGENMSEASRKRNNRDQKQASYQPKSSTPVTRPYGGNQKSYASWSEMLMRKHIERVWPEAPFDTFISGHIHVVEDFAMTPTLHGEDGAVLSGHPDTSAPVRAVNLGSWFDSARAFYLSKEKSGFIDIK